MSAPAIVRADVLAEGLYKRLLARGEEVPLRAAGYIADYCLDAAAVFVARAALRNGVTGELNHPGIPQGDDESMEVTQ